MPRIIVRNSGLRAEQGVSSIDEGPIGADQTATATAVVPAIKKVGADLVMTIGASVDHYTNKAPLLIAVELVLPSN